MHPTTSYAPCGLGPRVENYFTAPTKQIPITSFFRMDWFDLEVAAKPANSAFTPNSLLGHVIILLRRETRGLPFIDEFNGPHYSAIAGKAIDVTDLIWTKHRRKPRDQEPDVIRSMEPILEEIKNLFVLGLGQDPLELMSEYRFNAAAKTYCQARGEWSIGTYTGRFIPTDEDARAAFAVMQQDKNRLQEFENTDPIEWLRKEGKYRSKHQYWAHIAEKWASLRAAVDIAVSPGILQP